MADELDTPLSGLALDLWQQVVVAGEHVELHRDGSTVAVVVPIEDYEAMRAKVFADHPALKVAAFVEDDGG